jgi:glycosyltransferase involved in cell wall biosynthesis
MVSSISPLISIVLPTYNQSDFLPAALDSIFSQTFTNFELIVVNDGSTDSTAHILDNYRQNHSFVLIEQENQKLPRSLNNGFTCAKGKYLTWTSTDNIMMPEMLEVLSKELENDSTVGLVYADRYVIDKDGKILGEFSSPEYDPFLLLHLNMINCCFLYRRDCLDRVGGYDHRFIYGEDWEYWIRISECFKIKHINYTLYKYRLHPRSMTGDILAGKATGMKYKDFSIIIRKRAPYRWWIGKIKWWFIRFFVNNHPLYKQYKEWNDVLKNAR